VVQSDQLNTAFTVLNRDQLNAIFERDFTQFSHGGAGWRRNLLNYAENSGQCGAVNITASPLGVCFCSRGQFLQGGHPFLENTGVRLSKKYTATIFYKASRKSRWHSTNLSASILSQNLKCVSPLM